MKVFGRNRFIVVLSLSLLASFISSTSGQANTKLVKSGYEFVLPPGGQVKFNVRVEKDKWNQFQFRSKSIASWESNYNFAEQLNGVKTCLIVWPKMINSMRQS